MPLSFLPDVPADDLEMDFFRFGHGDRTMVILPGLSADSIINYAAMTDEFTVYVCDKLKDHTYCELYMYDGYGHAAYDLAPDYRERMLEFYLG